MAYRLDWYPEWKTRTGANAPVLSYEAASYATGWLPEGDHEEFRQRNL